MSLCYLPPGGSPVAKRQKIATSNAKVKNSTGLGPGFYLSQGIDTSGVFLPGLWRILKA